jgi:hypothetical protein
MTVRRAGRQRRQPAATTATELVDERVTRTAALSGGRSGLSAPTLSVLQRNAGNHAVAALLDRAPAKPTVQQGSSSRPVVQRYFDLKQATHAKLQVSTKQGTRFPGHQRDVANKDFLTGTTDAGAVNRVVLDAVPDLVVSDDGEMAMEASVIDGNREVEAFFASKKVLEAGKKRLSDVGSKMTLSDVSGEGLKVPDLATNALHNLVKVVGAKAGTYIVSTRPKGSTLQGPEQCIEMAEGIINTQAPKFLLDVTGGDPTFNTRDLGQQMLLYLGAYIDAYRPGGTHQGDHALSQKAALVGMDSPPPRPPERVWKSPVVEITTESKAELDEFKEALGRHTNKNQFKAVFTANMEDPRQVDEVWKLNIQVIHEGWADRWDTLLKSDDVAKHITGYDLLRTELIKKPINMEEASALLEARKVGLIDKINKSPAIFAEINKQLGMNERAAPEVGEAYEIFHKGDGSKATFPYHFAGVVAKSGDDTVTFENYARERKAAQGLDQRMYFQMYGPRREVTETADAIRHSAPGRDESAEQQEQRELAAGSFHGKWQGIFAEAQTVAVGKNARKRPK